MLSFFSMPWLTHEYPPVGGPWPWSNDLMVLERHLGSFMGTKILMLRSRLRAQLGPAFREHMIHRFYVLEGTAEAWTPADLVRGEALLQELMTQLR